MQFSHFLILPGSAEAQVIWCGVVKCLLIAYFNGNISAKKYQNPFTCLKVTASQRWGRFLRQGVHYTVVLNIFIYEYTIILRSIILQQPTNR